MKKAFGKTIYDTETAESVFKYTNGYYGDPNGYEEVLFRTQSGANFIYGKGGADSPYPEEKIARIAKDKVQAWIDERK